MAANATGYVKAGVPLPIRHAPSIPVLALGAGLSAFLMISYTLCVVGYLLFPALPINHAALAIFLPGFELLNWSTFVLGVVESFLWGWYVALIFGPLFNFFAARL
jgi:hypothetical protein